MNKKPLLLVFALLTLALWTAPALSETFTHGSISFEVPDKWTAEFDQDAGIINITQPADDYAIALVVKDSEGMETEEQATALAKSMNGSKPKAMEDSPDYYFNTIQDGVEITVTVTVVGPKALVVLEGGDYEPHGLLPYQIIRGTLTSTDPAEQALFDALPRLFKGNNVIFELPKGWKAVFDPKDSSIQAHNPAKDCAVTIGFTDGGPNVSAKEMATDISKSMNGPEPEPVNKNNKGFTFQVNSDGVDTQVTVVAVGSKVLFFIETGKIDANSDPISTIWSTLASTDPAEQAVIDEYFSDLN